MALRDYVTKRIEAFVLASSTSIPLSEIQELYKDVGANLPLGCVDHDTIKHCFETTIHYHKCTLELLSTVFDMQKRLPPTVWQSFINGIDKEYKVYQKVLGIQVVESLKDSIASYEALHAATKLTRSILTNVLLGPSVNERTNQVIEQQADTAPLTTL